MSSTPLRHEASVVGPTLLQLDDERAADVAVVGGKAAAVATAARHGVPTLPGAVLTTMFCEAVDAGTAIERVGGVAEAAAVGDRLVVRSSSVAEDTATSSAAGQFESVIDVRGHDEMCAAVRTVLDSRHRAGAADEPIAVLVQPFIEPDQAGVVFGVDPVTGRSDHRVVTAVDGQPDRLVGGEIDGSRYLLDRRGEVLEFERRDGPQLSAAVLRALVELTDRVAAIFGSPQDVEWALLDGAVVLLQSRPVTTEIHGVPTGPVYGPGPVAETFPERLAPLETDLWVPPLEEGVREALRLAASIPRSDLDGPDLVITVDGQAAIDLERTGEIEPREDRPPWFAVTKRIRRLRAAWRVGRLRTALPTLAERLVRRVDDDLESIPELAELTDRQLVALLGRGRIALRSLHAHEVLMGLLTSSGENKLTGASVAMRVLAEARTDGRSDDEIVTHSPIVLALTAPRITGRTTLPDTATTPDLVPGHGEEPRAGVDTTDAGVTREALRLRVRWVQELTGRAAWELGRRLHTSERLRAVDDIEYLTYEELAQLVTRRVEVSFDLLRSRRRVFEARQPEPLPARFRLSGTGAPVPHRGDRESGGGTGAGGGRATGVVSHDVDDPPAGAVLVVRTLAPGIGPLLTRLHGVVSETGSVLAHLAILAREAGVPTVVGHADALRDYAEGDVVTVDGDTGQVTRAEEEQS